MSTAPQRRPSTLAVDRAQAAARPLGAAPAPKAVVPVAKGPTAGSPVRGASAGGATSGATEARRADPRRTVQAVTARESRDNWVVLAVVGTFVAVAVVLMSMRVVTSAQQAGAREALGETFAVVHSQQADFRTTFGRYATWPELRDRGMQVGPRQSVKDWNATESHWFMSIRDLETGVICDRTGELFDESSGERPPVCRGPE